MWQIRLRYVNNMTIAIHPSNCLNGRMLNKYRDDRKGKKENIQKVQWALCLLWKDAGLVNNEMLKKDLITWKFSESTLPGQC